MFTVPQRLRRSQQCPCHQPGFQTAPSHTLPLEIPWAVSLSSLLIDYKFIWVGTTSVNHSLWQILSAQLTCWVNVWTPKCLWGHHAWGLGIRRSTIWAHISRPFQWPCSNQDFKKSWIKQPPSETGRSKPYGNHATSQWESRFQGGHSFHWGNWVQRSQYHQLSHQTGSVWTMKTLKENYRVTNKKEPVTKVILKGAIASKYQS